MKRRKRRLSKAVRERAAQVGLTLRMRPFETSNHDQHVDKKNNVK